MKITIFSILALCILFSLPSCSDDDGDTNIGFQSSDEVSVTWNADSLAGQVSLAVVGISSEPYQAVQTQMANNPSLQLVNASVNSILLTTTDVSSFNYLDSLAVYLHKTDTTLVNPLPIPFGDVTLVATLDISKRGQDFVALDIVEGIDVKEIIDNPFYNLYIYSETNDNIIPIVQDRIVDVEVTYDLELRN